MKLLLTLITLFSSMPVHALMNASQAAPGQFPSVVRMGSNKDILCGGVVIAPYVVLTAAHCINAKLKDEKFYVETLNAENPKKYKVRLDLASSDAGKNVSAIRVKDLTSDVGILLLEKPIDLPFYPELNFDKVPVGKRLLLTGYSNAFRYPILAYGFNDVFSFEIAPYLLGFKATWTNIREKTPNRTIRVGGDSGSPIFNEAATQVHAVTSIQIAGHSEVEADDLTPSCGYPLSHPEVISFLKRMKSLYPDEMSSVSINSVD